MTDPSLRRAVVLAGLLSTGCGDARHEPPGSAVVETGRSTDVVQDSQGLPGAGDSIVIPGSDTVRARRVALIGEIDGQAETTFGSISSIAVDPAGQIYVSDAMGEDVRAFSASGQFLYRIGRGGSGPGEFRRPYGLALGPAAELFVADETRVQRFARSEDSGRYQYVGSFPAPPYGFGIRRGVVDRDGRYYFERRTGRIPEQRFLYVVLDSAGETVDTLALPPSIRMPVQTAILRTGRSGGRMIPGLSRAPFTPVASWSVTPDGTLLVSDGSTYEIAEISVAGDTLRVIRKQDEPRGVPPREYRDSLRAVRERIASTEVPVDRLEGVAEEIRTGELRRTLPQVLGVHVATDGRIWVERWPAEGEAGSAFDVFSRDGSYVASVLVPSRFALAPAPVFTADRIVGVVLDEETDVQRLAVYEVAVGR